MEQKFYSTTAQEWADLVVDAFLNSSAYVQVGTGWSGDGAGARGRCNAPTGCTKILDSGYPVLERERGGIRIRYRATFPAGCLDAEGINEACLLRLGKGSPDRCFAYAGLSPAADVRPGDTLRIQWEITIGAGGG
jgi:hypothetical protein